MIHSNDSVNVYDFDHTIYQGDASVHFIIYCLSHNIKLWKYLPMQALALLKYVFGLYNRKQVKQAAFSFLTELKDVNSAVTTFWEIHRKNIKSWYITQQQENDVIISASPKFLLEPIAKQLGIRTLLATEMDPLTGKIRGQNCRGVEKLRRLQRHNDNLVIENCYSDSLSDKPLMQTARHAYVVQKHTITSLADYKPPRVREFQNPAFLRFLFVGGINALLGIVFAYIISFLVSNALLAWVIGYTISLLISYPLNAVVTFRRTSFSLGQFGSFCVSYIPNFAVQFVCVHLLVDYLGLYRLLAYVLAVIIAVPITFLLLSKRTFPET